MRGCALCLLVCASLSAQVRYARLGEIEGTVEAQIHPWEPWRSGLRNAPLVESSWIRTGPASFAEVELDDGSVLRLAENSLCELADYTRLSTGQRITHIALDRGVAYFAGESAWRDAMVISAPLAQISIRRGSRIRLEAGSELNRLAVLEGEVRLSSAIVELDVAVGRMLKLDLNRPDKFYLIPEIEGLDSDAWNFARDKILASDSWRNRLPGLHYGMRDLDGQGEWIDTAEFGLTWKPKVPTGWAPFRDGKWQWYEGLGFTWISAESWGWVPYHYGRWMLQPTQGWIWAPGSRPAFKPGDVYWMRGPGLLGWGPLAPGEIWTGSGAPALYLKANTTFAKYVPSPNLREIDPAGFGEPPREPLAAAAFFDAPIPPRWNEDRLEYVRDSERAGLIRLSPVTRPAEQSSPASRSRPAEPERPPITQAPPPVSALPRRVVTEQPVIPFVITEQAPEPIVETQYLAPIFTGIIVINPPEKRSAKPDPKRPNRPNPPRRPNAAETARADIPEPAGVAR